MRTINVECKLKEGEDAEKLIKRFFRKCKKLDILKEYSEKIFYRSKGQKRRDKILKNRYLSKYEK